MMQKIALPPYTRLLSPQIQVKGKDVNACIGDAVRKLDELVQRLPAADSFHTVIRSSSHLLLPFQLIGFSVSAKFTFVSDADVSIQAVLDGMNQKQRNLIKAAKHVCVFQLHHDLDRFLKLSRDRPPPDHNDYAVLSALWTEAHKRGRAVFMAAEAGPDHDLAGAFLVWDDDRVYFLVSARRSGADANKASAGVFYQSVAFAKDLGRAFDADGYATAASAKSLLKWGIPPALNMNINRSSLKYSVLKPLKDRVVAVPF